MKPPAPLIPRVNIILRDPTILLLDEATSALDTESEHYIKVILQDYLASDEDFLSCAYFVFKTYKVDKIVLLLSYPVPLCGKYVVIMYLEIYVSNDFLCNRVGGGGGGDRVSIGEVSVCGCLRAQIRSRGSTCRCA
ncbi:uncharacterized protein A4U43_C07F21740 [Asparagus officinalis]|uniref:ABC transporter domain-containing protein n=1 Tax=Asparagus officinalis TaxID=4686 RepID=A0A5P1EDV1_ASPOF|nr:uncharacterized protein A4U43_C07F21740 [Asparagus officinalis]